MHIYVHMCIMKMNVHVSGYECSCFTCFFGIENDYVIIFIYHTNSRGVHTKPFLSSVFLRLSIDILYFTKTLFLNL